LISNPDRGLAGSLDFQRAGIGYAGAGLFIECSSQRFGHLATWGVSLTHADISQC
jgi:hypothetical protein